MKPVTFVQLYFQRLLILGLLAPLVISAGGCGHTPRSGMVRGDVSIVVKTGETPLEGAQLDISNPDNGEAYGGTLDANGAAIIHGIAIGKYVVTLLPPAGDPPLPGIAPTPRQEISWKIPRQIQKPETTPIVAEVVDGKNSFVFDLKDYGTMTASK